jgi:hypothetical protein
MTEPDHTPLTEPDHTPLTEPDHSPIAFAQQEVPYSGKPTVRWPTDVDDEIVVTMYCPACQAKLTEEIWPGGVHGTKGFLRNAPAIPTGPQPFICACGYDHDGRPDSSIDTGCGAFWKVELA